MLGSLVSDQRIRDHQILIDNQETLPRATWCQFHQMALQDLPINEDDFVRMWKTLILKRVQDVYEFEKHRRADHYVHLVHNINVPAHLADLLYSLGPYFDPLEGVNHHITPPPRPAVPQPWWLIDDEVLQNWSMTMNLMAHLFEMKQYPQSFECISTPLIHTSIQDDAGLRTIRARYKGPTESDVFLRLLNDEIFGDPYPISDCAYMMTGPIYREAVMFRCLQKYIKNSVNSY